MEASVAIPDRMTTNTEHQMQQRSSAEAEAPRVPLTIASSVDRMVTGPVHALRTEEWAVVSQAWVQLTRIVVA